MSNVRMFIAAQAFMLSAALLLTAPSPAQASPAEAEQPYPSAAACGACHKETYDSWARTFHALSAIDPVFVEALDRSRQTGDRDDERSCLACHSPTTIISGDYNLQDPVSREGITCSFCHSVTSVDLEALVDRFGNDPERLVAAMKSDNMKEHHFEQHDLTMSSEFCAGCHEWTNRHGLKILSTYSEWQESFYAGDKISCQQCHMPQSLGVESAPEGSKLPQPTNIHFQMGGHSQDQLVAAARLEVKPLLEDETVHLDVALTNFTAGHKLPTGIPTRTMHLNVELFDREGILLDSEVVVYGRTIVDREGNVLKDVTDQFLRGVRETSDNRLKPKETRTRRFTFARPPGNEFMLAEVSVLYEIQTPNLVPPVVRFDVVKKRLPLGLPAAAEGGSGRSTLPSLAIIAATFIIVTLIMTALLRRRGAGANAN